MSQLSGESLAERDSGLAALGLIARYHNISTNVEHVARAVSDARLTVDDIVLCARRIGMRARKVAVSLSRFEKTPFPAIAHDKDGRFFVVGHCDGASAVTLDMGDATPRLSQIEAVYERCGGQLMLFASRASLAGELAKFDFTWFIPAVVRYRHLLLEVLGVSILLQAFGLVTPLVFQAVTDKVLTNQASSTLAVACIALVAAGLFECALSGLRNYVLAHTTNRMDVELGARLYKHLIELPVSYFSSRRVGDTVARVKEIDNIRNFLTGHALTGAIDLLFSVVFFGVMLLYSVKLTLLVLLSLPLYAAISAFLMPGIRARLAQTFTRGADNHSFLVESIAAAETIKSMSVEPMFIRKWEGLLAQYVGAAFSVTRLTNTGQQLIQVVNKLVTAGALYIGATLVIEGKLSVGQLIAFNMLAQHVAAPVLRLAQLWQDFQQVALSVRRLGDVLNTRTEIRNARQSLPAIKGNVSFSGVSFRYRPDAPLALDDVSIDMPSGKVTAIVGRSGSGKSTLTKLLQCLYLPDTGRVSVDDFDTASADPTLIRRQLGVVLQDNVLFNRSIRDNIALAHPGAPLEAVIQAAKLTGAHEFIVELPDGYDTIVGERGADLSGGQRQRVAIARALLGNPKILIFDEATSALDVETEQVIQRNMKDICRGRTVIIISHRLTSIRGAARIVVLERGRVAECGTHDQLVAREGVYAAMWAAQSTSW